MHGACDVMVMMMVMMVMVMMMVMVVVVMVRPDHSACMCCGEGLDSLKCVWPSPPLPC